MVWRMRLQKRSMSITIIYKNLKNYPRLTQDPNPTNCSNLTHDWSLQSSNPPWLPGLCSGCGAMRGPMKTLLACSDALPQQNERSGSSFLPVVDMDVRHYIYISLSPSLAFSNDTRWQCEHPFLRACTQMFTLSIHLPISWLRHLALRVLGNDTSQISTIFGKTNLRGWQSLKGMHPFPAPREESSRARNFCLPAEWPTVVVRPSIGITIWLFNIAMENHHF